MDFYFYFIFLAFDFCRVCMVIQKFRNLYYFFLVLTLPYDMQDV